MIALPHRSAARRAALGCALAALLFAPARALDDLTQWAHGQDLYFDTSPNGAGTSGAVRDFPVLLRLRPSNFSFSQAMSRGQDFRITRPDGVPLSYEIERWDSAGAKAEVWVRVDNVPANFQGAFARMYWGKPGAVDRSDANAVFNASIGFMNVWHMGGPGTGPRPNAVANKPPAVPGNFDSDESKEGAVGLSDSLDGNASGDHLDIGDGYTEFANALTFSAWAYPTRNSTWGRIFDLGNGAGLDNIYLARRDNSQDLCFALWSGGLKVADLSAPAILYPNQWSLFTVTVFGKAARIYRNGTLVASGDLAVPVSNIRRAYNYVGRSNWAGDEYFAGKLDELEMHDVARGADWVKLAYANQKPGQNLVWFAPPPSLCAQKFSAPADTVVNEGSYLELAGVADCATGFQWASLSGPAPRILDPEVKVLQVPLPRITQDTSIVYRFTANFGGSAKTRDVLVRVKESIPEPVFTLPALPWNGRDSILVKPIIANLDAIKASKEPRLYYSWTASSATADTSWRKDGLLLRAAPSEGPIQIGLCLHNNGPVVCRTSTVTVNRAVGLAAPVETPAAAAAPRRRDARGRIGRNLRSLPAFPADRAR